MKKTMMKMNRSFILVLTMLVYLMISFFLIGNSNTVWAASNIQISQVKEYWRGTIDEDFDDSSVLVVMDKQRSGINKSYEDSFFGNFSREAVYDLTFTNKNTKDIDTYDFNQILQIKLPERSKENVVNVIRELEQIEGILWAGPNHYDRPALQPPSATVPPTGVHRYPLLWGLHGNRGIQAEEAWDLTTGVHNNVRVGVIDSGMDNHPDIAANRVNEGGDFVNMENLNQIIPGPLRADPDGHGTHVAGTIGATGVSPNGVTGVAWNVQLIPLQVSFWHADSAEWRWDVAAVTRAISWASDNDIDVINYSGGGTNDNVARRTAIGSFQGLFICAAGNNGRSNENNEGTNRLYYPADYSRNQTFSNRVISVGAINNVGNRANFSNWGAASVSIFAPGTGIWSSVPNAINTNGYDSWQGTSMATPHVTGTAALMYSLYTQMGSSLTRAQRAIAIKTAIMNNAVVDAGSPLNGLCVSNGRLNAFRALSSIAFNATNIGENELRINSLNFNHNGNLLIPENYNGRVVTQVDSSAFINQTQLTRIRIPQSVTHIGSDAFKNTNNAAIYLEGRISVPSTFNVNWNVSGNPVYLNGNLCTHPSTTLTNSNHTQHGQLCDDCRTFVGKTNHNHNHSYIPYGTAPLGVAVHLSLCTCNDSVVTPCVSRFPHEPGDTVMCWYCGQIFSNPMLYTITLSNGEVFVSNVSFTFEMYKELSSDLGLVYSYNTYLLESAQSQILNLENHYNKTTLLPFNIQNHGCNDYSNNCLACHKDYYECFDCDFIPYIDRKELLFIIENKNHGGLYELK